MLLLLAGLSVFRLQPPSALTIQAEKSAYLTEFPLSIGGWQGSELPPDELAEQILETKNILNREYVNTDGGKVTLLMVVSKRDRRVAHPPEVCYTASNYNIMDRKEAELPAGGESYPVNLFRAVHERHPDYSQDVLYLYKVGNRYTTNYYAQQLQFAFDRLTRKESEVILIRISSSDAGAVQAFFKSLIPVINAG